MDNHKTTHTPEPWRFGKWTARPEADWQVFCDALEVTPCPSVTLEADAARIVACVNACEGIADPEESIRQARDVIAYVASVVDAYTNGEGTKADLAVIVRDLLKVRTDLGG